MNDIESDSGGLNSLFPELRNLSAGAPRGEPLLGLKPKILLKPIWPLVIVPVFIAVALMVIFTIIFSTSSRRTQYTATATIVKVENVSTLDSDSGTVVRYRFQVQGRSYDGILTTIAAERRSFKPGDHLFVVYDLANPNRSQEKPKDIDVASIIAIAIFLPVWGFFVLGMWFIPFLGPKAKLALRARGLWKSGRLTQGTLVFVKTPALTRYYFGGTQEVIFRFHDEQQLEHTVSMGCDNAWLLNQLHPDIPLVVLYDRKKPARAIFLETFLA